jgi:hypothetical protein
MTNHIQINLEQPEYSALIQLAVQELRSPSDQVVMIVRNELIHRGLLSNGSLLSKMDFPQAHHSDQSHEG